MFFIFIVIAIILSCQLTFIFRLKIPGNLERTHDICMRILHWNWNFIAALEKYIESKVLIRIFPIYVRLYTMIIFLHYLCTITLQVTQETKNHSLALNLNGLWGVLNCVSVTGISALTDWKPIFPIENNVFKVNNRSQYNSYSVFIVFLLFRVTF